MKKSLSVTLSEENIEFIKHHFSNISSFLDHLLRAYQKQVIARDMQFEAEHETESEGGDFDDYLLLINHEEKTI